jgi:hypothetical protein
MAGLFESRPGVGRETHPARQADLRLRDAARQTPGGEAGSRPRAQRLSAETSRTCAKEDTP